MYNVPRILEGPAAPRAREKGGTFVKTIKQAAIIFALCFVSLCIEKVLPIPFPASVISMVLLLILLFAKVIRPAQIRDITKFLMEILPMLFVPAAVSIMNYFDVIRENFVPLMTVCVVSLVVTFAATAYAVQLTMHLMKKLRKKEKDA